VALGGFDFHVAGGEAAERDFVVGVVVFFLGGGGCIAVGRGGGGRFLFTAAYEQCGQGNGGSFLLKF
jgi:hypothetical protein